MIKIIITIVFFVLWLTFLYFQVKVWAKASDKLQALCALRLVISLLAGVLLLVGIIGYSPENFDNWEQRYQQYVQNAQFKQEILSDIKAKLGDDMQNSSDAKKDVYAEYLSKVNTDLKNVQAQANVVLPEHPNSSLLKKIGLWAVGAIVGFIIALLVGWLWKIDTDLTFILYLAVTLAFSFIWEDASILELSIAPLMSLSEIMIFVGILFVVLILGMWGLGVQFKKLEDKH